MHHSPNPQTRFFSRTPPSSGRTKRFARISMMHPARTTRPKRCVGGKSESVTKGRPISELGVLHPRQIGNSEKPSAAQTSSLISAAVGVVAPRCWPKVPRAFLTSFCRNPGSRSRLAIPCRSSVAKDAHRRVVHKKAWRRLTPCSIDLPTINDANGRNRCRADAAHFDALRDERTGDENRLLSHFFVSLLAGLDRRVGK
jgi:hypothetical protein